MYNLKSLKNVSKIVLLVVLTLMLSVLFVGCDNKKGADVSNENKITLTNEQCKVAIQAAATATETATKQEMNSNVLSTQMLLSQSNENDFLFIEDESKYVIWDTVDPNGYWSLVPKWILQFGLDAGINALNSDGYVLNNVVSGDFKVSSASLSDLDVMVKIANNELGYVIGECGFFVKNTISKDIIIMGPNGTQEIIKSDEPPVVYNCAMTIRFEVNYDFKTNKLVGFDANFYQDFYNDSCKRMEKVLNILKYNDNILFMAKVNADEMAPEGYFHSGASDPRTVLIIQGKRLDVAENNTKSLKNSQIVKGNLDFTDSANKYLSMLFF